ncbi:MAG: hypothetical protein AAB541_03650, partial [Patescibacteria group bacterium]
MDEFEPARPMLLLEPPTMFWFSPPDHAVPAPPVVKTARRDAPEGADPPEMLLLLPVRLRDELLPV